MGFALLVGHNKLFEDVTSDPVFGNFTNKTTKQLTEEIISRIICSENTVIIIRSPKRKKYTEGNMNFVYGPVAGFVELAQSEFSL